MEFNVGKNAKAYNYNMIFAKVFTGVIGAILDAILLILLFLMEFDMYWFIILAVFIAFNFFMFICFRYLANSKPCLIVEDDVVLLYKGKKLQHEISREGAAFFEGPYKQMKVMPRQGSVLYLQLNFLDPSDYDLLVNMLIPKQRQNVTKEQHPFETN